MQQINHDGSKGPIEPFDKKKMEKFLNDPKVKEVRVFRLKKGMTVDFKGTTYKVTAVRPNGKVTLREKR